MMVQRNVNKANDRGGLLAWLLTVCKLNHVLCSGLRSDMKAMMMFGENIAQGPTCLWIADMNMRAFTLLESIKTGI